MTKDNIGIRHPLSDTKIGALLAIGLSLITIGIYALYGLAVVLIILGVILILAACVHAYA